MRLQSDLKVSLKLYNSKGIHETFRKSKVCKEYKSYLHYILPLSKWFNPYRSFGLDLDRAICSPALGIKVGSVSAKGSIWYDLTTSGMLAINVNAAIYKLKMWDIKRNYIGLRGTYLNAFSGHIK